ncbi:MAG: hypothetical protein ABW360_15490 [Phenylobacterium sp.]
MADGRRGGVDWTPSGAQLAGGFLDGHAEALKKVGDTMLRDAPKMGRIVAKRIPGLPGLVFDAASYATAKDKNRAKAELAGQVIGGAIGGLAGPLGAAAGSVIGEKGGELLYDHRDDIAAWMKARQAQVNRAAYGFEHAFDRGLPPYSPYQR